MNRAYFISAICIILVGCNTTEAAKQDAQTLGSKVGAAVDKGVSKTGEVVNKVMDATGEGLKKAGAAVKSAGETVGEKLK